MKLSMFGTISFHPTYLVLRNTQLIWMSLLTILPHHYHHLLQPVLETHCIKLRFMGFTTENIFLSIQPYQLKLINSVMLSGILVSPGFLCHEYFAHRTLWSPMHDFFCEVVVGQPWHIWWLANHRLFHGWPITGWLTSNYVKLANLYLANYWLADLVGILSLHI